MTDEHVLDLLPGYALGILDDDDLMTVARHLPHCATCQAELAALKETTGRLALAVPPREPPAHLRNQVLARVARESAGSLAPLQPKQAQPSFVDILRGFFAHPLGLAVGAMALLLILALGASSVLLWQRVNDLQARIPPGNMRVVHLAGTTNAPEAMGYMMVFTNENYGTLAVENAPVLDPNHQYQIWLVRDGKRVSGGVFSVDESGYGTLEIVAGQPLDTFQSFGITIEPTGGSPQPTGKKVLGSST